MLGHNWKSQYGIQKKTVCKLKTEVITLCKRWRTQKDTVPGQLKDPCLLLQYWPCWQLCAPELHSSTSIHADTHCVPIKTTAFHFTNNSVKNQMIWIIFGMQNPEEISHKWYVARPRHLKNDTTIPYERQILCICQLFHQIPREILHKRVRTHTHV